MVTTVAELRSAFSDKAFVVTSPRSRTPCKTTICGIVRPVCLDTSRERKSMALTIFRMALTTCDDSIACIITPLFI